MSESNNHYAEALFALATECGQQAGYLQALEDHGIPFDEALLSEAGGFNMEQAYRGTEALLNSGAEFTAIFTVSDAMAIAVIKALADHGRRVPEDCSVIGIDGIGLSNYCIPTLTTMVQPVEQMARESVRILLDMLYKGAPSRHLLLPTTLREGGSVRQL